MNRPQGAAAPIRIAVVGCGAMGSVYAARLAAVGNDVLVVSRRSDHVRAMSEHGLRVSGPDGELVAAVRAFESVPNEQVDLVILAVKASGVAEAASSLEPLIGDNTVVLTIQNGLGSADELAGVIGGDRLAVGIASGFGASLSGAGRAHHNAMKAVRLGSYSNLPAIDVERVAEVWRRSGFDAEAVDDIVAMQWEKLICNVAYSAPCALTGLTVGGVLEDEQMGPVSRAAAVEAWETAIGIGVAIEVADPIEFVRDFGSRMPDAKPSALLDHEARRASEIGVINGAIPREAAKLGRTAPVNATLTALALTRERAF